MANLRKLKPKTCRNCKKEYQPFKSMQVTCSPSCAIAYVTSQNKKAAKAEVKKREKVQRVSVMIRKNAIKTRSQWLKEAQVAINLYIRLRDRGRPCISCDWPDDGTNQRHASHYRSRGAAPELRFDETNIHASCAQCNTMKSGNVVEYRLRLVDRIGQEALDRLEGPHDPKKYTIDEIKEIKVKYRDKSKELRL